MVGVVALVAGERGGLEREREEMMKMDMKEQGKHRLFWVLWEPKRAERKRDK